jgi:endo-1,4-beta-xylanase
VFSDESGNPVTKDVLIQRMKDHVTNVVTHFKGRVSAWDVVNEAIYAVTNF